MVFQKFDPRAAYFNIAIRRIYDAGLIDYFYTMTIPYEDIKLEESVQEEALILEYFFVPFIFFWVGLLTASIIFAKEILRKDTKRGVHGINVLLFMLKHQCIAIP